MEHQEYNCKNHDDVKTLEEVKLDFLTLIETRGTEKEEEIARDMSGLKKVRASEAVTMEVLPSPKWRNRSGLVGL